MHIRVSTLHFLPPALLALALLLLLLSAGNARPARAQAPGATPDPTIVALQEQVDHLSTRVADFEMKVDLNQQSLENKTFEQFLPLLIWSSVVAVIAIIFGVASPLILLQRANERTRQQLDRANERTRQQLDQADERVKQVLDQAVYRADPTNLTIHVPQDDFTAEATWLERIGFHKLRSYKEIEALTGDQLDGVVIYPARNIDDVRRLAKHIQSNHVGARQAAFIIYTGGRIENGEEIYQTFRGVTYANNVVTIAVHIYSLARMLGAAAQ